MIHPKGHIVNIDNDTAFDHGPSIHPWYMDNHREETLHPKAAEWIKGLDAKDLVGKMADQGHNAQTIKTSAAKLKMYQKLADRKDFSLDHMRNTVQAAIMPKAAAAPEQKKAV